MDVPDFPIEVLREAIVNALVHRDYEIEGAKSEIKIDENKVIVTSPGKPLPAISLDELNTFEAPSLSRNPIITYAFSLMDYVEEKGFGMKTFKSLKENFGLPIPKFTFEEPFLTLTFPRTVQGVKSVVKFKGIEKLSDVELAYFEIFREKSLVSKAEFIEYTELAERSAQRLLKKWVDGELIVMEGAGRSTRYRIND